MDFPVLGFAFLFGRANAGPKREGSPGEMLICIFQSCAGNHFIFYVTQLWRAHAAPKLGDAEKMPLSSPRFLFCARCGPVWHAPDEGSASINTLAAFAITLTPTTLAARARLSWRDLCPPEKCSAPSAFCVRNARWPLEMPAAIVQKCGPLVGRHFHMLPTKQCKKIYWQLNRFVTSSNHTLILLCPRASPYIYFLCYTMGSSFITNVTQHCLWSVPECWPPGVLIIGELVTLKS